MISHILWSLSFSACFIVWRYFVRWYCKYILAPVWLQPRELRLCGVHRAALHHLPNAVPVQAGRAPRPGALPGLDRPDPVQPPVPGHTHQTRLLWEAGDIQYQCMSGTYWGSQLFNNTSFFLNQFHSFWHVSVQDICIWDRLFQDLENISGNHWWQIMPSNYKQHICSVLMEII